MAILRMINSDKKRSEKRDKIKGLIQLQTTGSRQRKVAILSFSTSYNNKKNQGVE